LNFPSSNRNFGELERQAVAELVASGWKTDYVAARQQSGLQPLKPEEQALVTVVAARLGAMRLIDNIEI